MLPHAALAPVQIDEVGCQLSDARLFELMLGALDAAQLKAPGASVSRKDARVALEQDLGIDLSKRRQVLKDAASKWNLSERARHLGCVLVPHLNTSCIRRHAEGSANRRSNRGIEPEFPEGLQQMRQVLGHGGLLAKDATILVEWYPIENGTNRCACYDSTYRGVLSAVGLCKHAHLRDICLLCTDADTTASVHDEVFDSLSSWIRRREGSKPRETQCRALLTAATPEALLAALARHPSIPSTGKGVPSATAAEESWVPCWPAAMAAEDEEEAEEEADQSAIEVEESSRDLSAALTCTFTAAAWAGGLGLILAAAGGGSSSSMQQEAVHGLLVVAFGQLEGGAMGPAPSTGDELRPGDVVVNVNDEDACAKMLTEDGKLNAVSGDLRLRFIRRALGSAHMDLGGRPAKAKAKAKWGSSMHADGADTELLGGVPSRAPKKPRPIPVSERAAQAVEAPTSEEVSAINRCAALAAELGRAHPIGAFELRQVGLGARWEESLQQLLAQRELDTTARATYDAELLDACYLR